jgi:multidrug efflux pump subunit AcrA (membrane-fusion protein)
MNDTFSGVSETEEVKPLEERLAEVRAQLEAERSAGPFTLSGLQTDVAQAQAEAERAYAAAQRAKAQASKRKDEIDEWKAWYNSRPEDEKEVDMAKLQGEIKWRAAELEVLTPQIRDLLTAQASAAGNLELAQQRLTAFEAGVFEKPIEEDPRFLHLNNALLGANT